MPASRPALLLGAILAITAPHAHADDVARGLELAQEWCVRCHNIEPDGPFKQYPPSFASIAVYRSSEQIQSRIMIPPLHTSMPQLGFFLTPDNVDDLVAYIVSLETQ